MHWASSKLEEGKHKGKLLMVMQKKESSSKLEQKRQQRQAAVAMAQVSTYTIDHVSVAC